MSKKMRELLNKQARIKEEVNALLDKEGITAEEIEAKMAEIDSIEASIKALQRIEDSDDESEEETMKPINKVDTEKVENTTGKAVRATIKALMGRKLTEAEAALIRTGTNGESYILPQDIKTKIRELTRQLKSMRDILGYIPTNALTGSFPVEDFETVAELVDFTDGTDFTEATDIKFKNVTFSLKLKGAFIALGNTLLDMTDNDLVDYVARVFARKAVITENKMAFTVLKTGKTAKTIADWKALKKSINVDLDEGVKFGTVIVTNQDAFDVLDSALDGTGRPVLQPDPTSPTRKLFMGYPVEVFSNSLLPTEGTTAKTAPIFYGNLSMAAQFVDDSAYEFALSEHAEFKKNLTLARVIEHVDVIKTDGSDKVYLYGTIAIA